MFLKLQRVLLLCLLSLPAAKSWSQEAQMSNSMGMEFVLIPPGSIVIGRYQPTVGEYRAAPVRQDGRVVKVLPVEAYRVAEKMAEDAAIPGFTVTIRHPYYIGKFEVTQEQFEKVMGTNPSYFQQLNVTGESKRHPVENIRWKDAQAFISTLNRLDKTYKYRLPTEFEWEYAAAAGAPDDIPWAKAAATGVISEKSTRPVGSEKPNDWGLYDMIGNVWEWVQDHYNEKIFADPIPPRSGKEHVLKGASFTGDAKNATYKTHAAGPGNGFDVGMRIIMEIRK